MGENKTGNWISRVSEMAQRLWPVTLGLMAITILSQYEKLQLWSEGLAYVVAEWRSLMHGFWQMVINFLRRIVGEVSIKVTSPLPEALTFLSLLLTATRAKDFVEFHVSRLLAPIEDKFPLSGYIFGALIFSLGLVCILALFYGDADAFRIAAITCLFMSVIPTLLILIRRFLNIDLKSAEITEWSISFWVTSSLVVVLAVLTLLASYFVENLVIFFGNIITDFETFRATRPSD